MMFSQYTLVYQFQYFIYFCMYLHQNHFPTFSSSVLIDILSYFRNKYNQFDVRRNVIFFLC